MRGVRNRKNSEKQTTPFVTVLSVSVLLLIVSSCVIRAYYLSFSSSSAGSGSGSGSGSKSSIEEEECWERRSRRCRYEDGRWVEDRERKALYGRECPFQRNSWNCIKNGRPDIQRLVSWKWIPSDTGSECALSQIRPHAFLKSVRNMKIGFIGDSLNENLLVSFLCILHSADPAAKKWKRKGAWKGAFFPAFNVTVGYHRAVLLSKYQYVKSAQGDAKGFYRVDIDIPANDWINTTSFYDVFIFNTGHWWNSDKFPKETPLLFHQERKIISPRLDTMDGLRLVLKSTVSYIQKAIPKDKLVIWRMQSPRHFYGGDWNQNGSCTFNKLLHESKLDFWFDPKNGGVNREAREINEIIKEVLKGTRIYQLNLTHLSEYRADAHPAVWLGRHDAVSIWGQDCMHWCLPGVPDTWVDILSATIAEYLNAKEQCVNG